MPAGFQFPENTEIWTPSGVNVAEEPRDNRSYSVLGRLNPAVELDQAQSQISAINDQLAQAFPDTNKGWDAHLALARTSGGFRSSFASDSSRRRRPCASDLLREYRKFASGASGRPPEGSGNSHRAWCKPGRIVRQMLTESLLLSAIGGTLWTVLEFLADRTAHLN